MAVDFSRFNLVPSVQPLVQSLAGLGQRGQQRQQQEQQNRQFETEQQLREQQLSTLIQSQETQDARRMLFSDISNQSFVLDGIDINTPQGVRQFQNRFVSLIAENKGNEFFDMDEVIEARKQAMTDPEGVYKKLQQAQVTDKRQLSLLDAFLSPTKAVTGTASQRDFGTFQELQARASATQSPEDIEAARQFGAQSGFGRPTEEEAAVTEVSKQRDIAAAKAKIELETAGKIEGAKAAGKAAIAKSSAAFDKLGPINQAIANIDEAIGLIDDGAQTGVVVSMLPSIKRSSIALDNLQKRMGLDVIGQTTFGALSAEELKFALDSALPKKLEPQDLKRWLVRKKAAQQKLSNYLSSVATFLGTPGNTIPDFIELQKVKALEAEEAAQPPVQTSETIDPALFQLMTPEEQALFR